MVYAQTHFMQVSLQVLFFTAIRFWSNHIITSTLGNLFSGDREVMNFIRINNWMDAEQCKQQTISVADVLELRHCASTLAIEDVRIIGQIPGRPVKPVAPLVPRPGGPVAPVAPLVPCPGKPV